MDSAQIRQKFLKFFKDREHSIVPSASLVPENDPTVLFTTAGMQQFKPYYLGNPSPHGNRVVSAQKCVRTSDIEEVGDDTHLTFFEMLGNFSFGGYQKRDAILWAYEFITREMGLSINFISVFGGEGGVAEDKESIEIWKLIAPNTEIKKFGRSDNFWGPTGEEGPCGPTTEIYVNGIEIWNVVFNEFYQNKDKTFKPLQVKGIDTGMGLERLLVQVQKKTSVFETDLFSPIISKIRELSGEHNIKSERIIADHIRTSVFMVADGVIPSNKDRGYILRRLIRRAGFQMSRLNMMKLGIMEEIVGVIVNQYQHVYPELRNHEIIKSTISDELYKFFATYEDGEKIFHKAIVREKIHGQRVVPQSLDEIMTITAQDALKLWTSYGYPVELTKEIVGTKNLRLESDFDKKYKDLIEQHQALSRSGAQQKFKK